MSFFEIDLWLGVTREEAEAGKVLAICLEEIDRCRPYFLGMIGARYGWIDPEAARVLNSAPGYAQLAPFAGKSVTELEFRYGIVNRPIGAPEAQAVIYKLLPEASHETEPYEGLLASLAEAGIEVQEESANLDTFASRMRKDLVTLLDRTLVAETRRGVERRRAEAKAVELLLGVQVHPPARTMPSIEGLAPSRPSAHRHHRSCRLRKIHARRRARTPMREDAEVLVFSALRAGGWSDWREAIANIISQITVDASGSSPASERRVFRETVEAAAAVRRTVVVIDGIKEQISRQKPFALGCPDQIQNTTIVMSLRGGSVDAASLRQIGWLTVEINPPGRDFIAEMIGVSLATFGRRLDAAQLKRFSTDRDSALEQALAVEELRCVPSFEELDGAIDRLARLKGVPALADLAVARIASEHGPATARALTALALAPEGLSEAVLNS